MGFIFNNSTMTASSRFESRKCGMCNGHGFIKYLVNSLVSSNAETQAIHMTCPACGGQGFVSELVVTIGPAKQEEPHNQAVESDIHIT